MLTSPLHWPALLAVGALLLLAPSASGHAAFLGSQPAPGVRLESTPPQVTLSFTEPLNARLSRASLTAISGGARPRVEVRASADRLLLVAQRDLPAGAYRVRWHTVSTEDGHALEGSFSFGIRAAAAGSEHLIEQSPLARSGWLRVLLRALFYVAALLFVGGLLLSAIWAGRSRPTDGSGAARERRQRRVLIDAGWTAAGLAVAVALAEASDAAGGLSLDGTRDFFAGSLAGVGRAAAVLLLAGAALVAARLPRAGAALGLSAFAAVAASGHAASASPRALSIVNDWLHLIAGAVWLGGLAFILLVWAPQLRADRRSAHRALERDVLPAFGRIALPAFLLASATGAVSLLAHLGHLSALWQTGYGRVLSVKILLVGAIAAVSYVHALRLRPRLAAGPPDGRLAVRHWRLVRSEPALAVGVVAAVAVLVVFPLPPRQLGEAQDALAAGAVCDPCPLPAPAANELAVAENAGRYVVAGWLRRDGVALRGTIRVSDLRGRASTVQATVAGARQSSCGRGCLRFRRDRADALLVLVRDDGRTYVAKLPARWRPGAARRAVRLLERAQGRMRALRSVRQSELVSSGPGSYARTEYRLQAPDRMQLSTGTGVRSVLVAGQRWMRWPDSPSWQRESLGRPFSTRGWFRWTPYAQHVRLLAAPTGRQRRARVELALFDPGTPLWIRLTLDARSGRVLHERSISKAHFATSRYRAFDARTSIKVPEGGT